MPPGPPPAPGASRLEREFYGYRGRPGGLQRLPRAAACTPGTYGRQVHRSFHAAYLDRVRAYHATSGL